MTITKLTGEEEIKSTAFVKGEVELDDKRVPLTVALDRIDCGLIFTVDSTEQYYVDMDTIVLDVLRRLMSDRDATVKVKLELIKREAKPTA